MRPAAAIAFAIGLAITCVAAPRAQSASTSLAERTFATYSAGDRAAINRVVATDGFLFVSDVLRRSQVWRRTWNAPRTVFVVESAVSAMRAGVPLATDLFEAARAMVVARPDKPGVNAAGDALEARVHKIALATLILHGEFDLTEDYFDGIAGRLAAPGATADRVAGKLVDPRLHLARAIVREALTRSQAGITLQQAVNNLPPVRPVSSRMSGVKNMQQRVSEADDALTAAAKDPATAAEATLRRAYLFYRLGNARRAEATLLSISITAEPIVGYWSGLVYGRVLEALQRPADATVLYEAMARAAPGTQTAPLALAALFLKRGDHAAALGWAERARQARMEDPWPMYWTADARFISTWVEELRMARE